jgi:uncharacterized protein YqhQ
LAAPAGQVGGQAVIEGVMMRSVRHWSVAVRRPSGDVGIVDHPITPWAGTRRWLRLPLIRGVIALGESLVIGMKALAISASQAAGEDEDGEGLTKSQIGATLAFSLIVAVGLFFVLPVFLTSLLDLDSGFAFWAVEGVIRVGVFLLYIGGISLLPDLRRVFQYHAAEHKAINAYEAGEELVPERVQTFSLIHPRCGTAFLLWVMVIGIFVFAFVGQPAWYWLILSRILLLPLIAGIAYELIRFAGKHQTNPVLMTLLAPGLWLQRLTTRQPSLDQIEVSIRALQEVLRREGGITPDERKVEVMA